MFLTSGDIHADDPKLGQIKLTVSKDQALRKTQELFLEGRQINALYICTHEELRIAEKRKLSWHASADELLCTVCEGSAATDFFDEVAINVLKESAPIESLSELFHNEMNQRLERLRTIRRAIEETPEPAGAARRRPEPQPQPHSARQDSPLVPAIPSPSEQAGVSSGSSEVIDRMPPDPATPAVQERPAAATGPTTPSEKTKVMMILCSRNGTARQALCRFANQMNLQFEIVDYNANQPHAIIDQLYRHRNAKFAIIYWGEPSGKELPGSAHPERYIGFSLGFALGRLGRGRVFILGSTTTPPLPGFTRILVSQLDSGGGWQIQLARRMKAAGLDIDLNKLT